ncbi:hypothetical protein BIBO2_3127 [Brucella sp. BO2]|nr:hypothetical protein BIBO2_3127 [Brucella sp. BO2]
MLGIGRAHLPPGSVFYLDRFRTGDIAATKHVYDVIKIFIDHGALLSRRGDHDLKTDFAIEIQQCPLVRTIHLAEGLVKNSKTHADTGVIFRMTRAVISASKRCADHYIERHLTFGSTRHATAPVETSRAIGRRIMDFQIISEIILIILKNSEVESVIRQQLLDLPDGSDVPLISRLCSSEQSVEHTIVCFAVAYKTIKIFEFLLDRRLETVCLPMKRAGSKRFCEPIHLHIHLSEPVVQFMDECGLEQQRDPACRFLGLLPITNKFVALECGDTFHHPRFDDFDNRGLCVAFQRIRKGYRIAAQRRPDLISQGLVPFLGSIGPMRHILHDFPWRTRCKLGIALPYQLEDAQRMHRGFKLTAVISQGKP